MFFKLRNATGSKEEVEAVVSDCIKRLKFEEHADK